MYNHHNYYSNKSIFIVLFFSRDQINARPQSPTLIDYINKLYDEVCNFLSASQELWIHEASITEVFHLAKNMVNFKLAGIPINFIIHYSILTCDCMGLLYYQIQRRLNY